MARKLNGDAPKRGGNAGAMNTDLKEAADRILTLKKQTAGLQADIGKIKAENVKAHGIKMADFNTVLRWYSLELEDRNATMDNIKVCCEALGVGGQGSLFPDQHAGSTEEAASQP